MGQNLTSRGPGFGLYIPLTRVPFGVHIFDLQPFQNFSTLLNPCQLTLTCSSFCFGSHYEGSKHICNGVGTNLKSGWALFIKEAVVGYKENTLPIG